MDTEKCKVLLCALDKGSLSRAAEDLGYTTSGVSRMMAALESDVGFSLLIRSRKGVFPTEECMQLLPVFRELVRWAEQCSQLSREICGVLSGSVTVGTSYSAYFPWLAQVISAFMKEYPLIEVRLLQGSSSELSAAMDAHKADFCVISRREGPYTWIPLIEDPLMAWVPADHPLAALPAVPIKAFEQEPFIDTYPNQDTDNARAFARCRIVPNTKFTSMDNHATCAMVEAGLGISMNNWLTARDWNVNIRILPLEPPQIVSIGIIYPAAGSLSPAAKRFVEFARKRVAEIQAEQA